MSRSFLKMHGAGNDFVIFDARREPLTLTADQLRWIADRHRGIGCDQVVVIHPGERAEALLRFYNGDGGASGACGNATRCVAARLMAETGRDEVLLESDAGLLKAWRRDGRVHVDMGPPGLSPAAIPVDPLLLSAPGPEATLALPLSSGPLQQPVAVGMGNPHAVFFVADAERIDLAHWGPLLEVHPLFPERANISVVQLIGPDHLRQRVWERGAGITMACGSAACAALVAAVRRGLTDRAIHTDMDGGTLTATWQADSPDGTPGSVILTGPVALSFDGRVALETSADGEGTAWASTAWASTAWASTGGASKNGENAGPVPAGTASLT